MKVIVTGATGFVGKELVRELVENGINIVAIVRNSGKIPSGWKENNQIELIYGDLYNLEEVGKQYHITDADIFYHFGWYGTSGMERADISGQLENVQCTCDAVRLAVTWGCKTFVNAGSIMEYEVIKLMNSGNYIPGMANIYSTAKLTADYMARTLANSLSINYVNVIISNIYGVGEKSARFLNTTLRKMLKNETISLTHGNQLYDFIYITDAVRLIYAAGIMGKNNESYYIGNKSQKPLRSFILEMKTILESESELEFGTVPLNAPSITYKEFDTYKGENELGIKPQVSFAEGILKVKKWMMSEENEQ